MNWEQIKTNIASIGIVALLSIGIGYVLGTSQAAEMTRKIEKNAERLDRWDKTAEARRKFMNDAANRVEFLCSRDADCRNRFNAMEVPE